MNDAFWLILALPTWYFSTVAHPFSAGLLSALPAFGVVCLAFGAVAGAVYGERRLFLFAISILLSEFFVAIAVLRGAFAGDSKLLLIVFLAIQLGITGYLVCRLRSAWMAALPLAIFCITYALFVAFISGMAFGNVWL